MASASDRLAPPGYVRQRRTPDPRDSEYLLLSDLRVALVRFRSAGRIRVLDYCCGGSPYRDLFPQADYRRADIPAIVALDYSLDASWVVPEEDASFEVVLSTRVLEHLRQPQSYLTEACRLVKPSGCLICTMHGSFPDHGCPDDHHRWTADALCQELRQAGFDPTETLRITTDARALLYLMEEFASSIAASRRTLSGLCLWLLRRLLTARREAVHEQADKHFGRYQVVPASDSTRLHLGLLCVAEQRRCDRWTR